MVLILLHDISDDRQPKAEGMVRKADLRKIHLKSRKERSILQRLILSTMPP
jgi:hypothetical protein